MMNFLTDLEKILVYYLGQLGKTDLCASYQPVYETKTGFILSHWENF